jgi:hypothetical protein
MQGWLHDAAVQAFFASLESQKTIPDEELLLSELYLRQHGRPFDEPKLVAAIARLGASSRKTTILEYASAIRHQAFVPCLIEMADGKTEENFVTPQRALQAITFQQKIVGIASWRDWYRMNGRKGRDAWMRDAAERLNRLAATDLPAARAYLSEAIYNWDDPAMLPYMERLAAFKGLRSEIVGWINLTYAEAPFLRDRLRPLAVRIRNESAAELEEWAKRLISEWDFLEPPRETWKEYIRLSNCGV